MIVGRAGQICKAGDKKIDWFELIDCIAEVSRCQCQPIKGEYYARGTIRGEHYWDQSEDTGGHFAHGRKIEVENKKYLVK